MSYLSFVPLGAYGNGMFYIQRAAQSHEVFPLGLHQVMFIPTIQRQGTREQVDQYVKKAENHEILGTYAQTELGHGNLFYHSDPILLAFLASALACFRLCGPTVVFALNQDSR